jgi:hypothetical protein
VSVCVCVTSSHSLAAESEVNPRISKCHIFKVKVWDRVKIKQKTSVHDCVRTHNLLILGLLG